MPHHIQPILVAIDAHPKANILLRAAANKAREMECGWSVVYVETSNHDLGPREHRKRVLRYLTQAEEMGATVYRVVNNDKAGSIISLINEAHANGKELHTLIIGKTYKEGFLAELKKSTTEKVAHQLRNTETSVQIIALSGKHYRPSWFERLQLRNIKLTDLLFSALYVAIAYCSAELLRSSIATIEWRVNVHNVTSFFLIATVVSALRFGMFPGLFAALSSFTLINYFYVEPLRSFGITHSAESVNLLIFLGVSIFISLIGAYSRAGATSAARKERRSQALHTLYRSASEATNSHHALEIMHDELTDLLEMEVVFFMPQTMNRSKLEMAYPANVELEEKDEKALEKCWLETRTTGMGTTVSPLLEWRFEPMVTPKGDIGVLGIKLPDNIRLDASFGRLLSSLADQAASILERIELTRMMSESQMREEREKLRAMLLSSVSHDLKTPLASIIGSLSVYKRMKNAGRLKEEIAEELTETALDEAQRLDSFISNILDMTRIESGDINFNKDWIAPDEMVAAVQKRLRLRLRGHTLHIGDMPKGLEVQCDQMMSEQVLQNIMDNAGKYSPKGTSIHVDYLLEDERFCIQVRDEGDGVPEDKLEAVFDKYERLKQSDSKVAGTGLGLAICRAIMDKQGGEITVSNHPDGGAVFRIYPADFRVAERGEEAA